MPNQLLTDSISSTAKFLDTAFEIAVEQEILLADYDKSVFKIVKTCVDHTITQKYINGNKLICEGYFRISIFYQPPQEDKLTVITKKQPFRLNGRFSCLNGSVYRKNCLYSEPFKRQYQPFVPYALPVAQIRGK